MGLNVSMHRVDRVVRLAPVGDLDLVSGEVLRDAIVSALAGEVDALVIDLEAVGFLDSSGITVLVLGRQAASERRVRYQVVGASGPVARVLEVAGVTGYLTGGSSYTGS